MVCPQITKSCDISHILRVSPQLVHLSLDLQLLHSWDNLNYYKVSSLRFQGLSNKTNQMENSDNATHTSPYKFTLFNPFLRVLRRLFRLILFSNNGPCTGVPETSQVKPDNNSVVIESELIDRIMSASSSVIQWKDMEGELKTISNTLYDDNDNRPGAPSISDCTKAFMPIITLPKDATRLSIYYPHWLREKPVPNISNSELCGGDYVSKEVYVIVFKNGEATEDEIGDEENEKDTSKDCVWVFGSEAAKKSSIIRGEISEDEDEDEIDSDDEKIELMLKPANDELGEV
jgi:hypothetical protein